MKYPYLLLDADNTLFDFDAGNRHAFHEVCARYDIPDTDESFLCYERCNNAMWTAFDRGECTKDFLVIERFRLFLKEMGLDRNPVLCNDLHLQVLGQNTLMLPHAQEVCRMLSQEHRLYIVTNAVASVQRSRLEGSAIASYISGAFISEEAGASKPSAACGVRSRRRTLWPIVTKDSGSSFSRVCDPTATATIATSPAGSPNGRRARPM